VLLDQAAPALDSATGLLEKLSKARGMLKKHTPPFSVGFGPPFTRHKAERCRSFGRCPSSGEHSEPRTPDCASFAGRALNKKECAKQDSRPARRSTPLALSKCFSGNALTSLHAPRACRMNANGESCSSSFMNASISGHDTRPSDLEQRGTNLFNALSKAGLECVDVAGEIMFRNAASQRQE
jgi:hypothetical protein